MSKHAIKFDSIDPEDTDFTDLQPLKDLIGDAKIVQLGEQSHGDGKCFKTKTRLIKFLHQEMGFDVLAFESGIYDCDRAWMDFKNPSDGSDDTGLSSARLGVFGIWTGSRQTSDLWHYIAEQIRAQSPLELAGYDCQFTASASNQFLSSDIEELAADLQAKLSDEEFESVTKGCQDLASFKKATVAESKFHSGLDTLITATREKLDGKPNSKLAHWHQVLVSTKALAEYRWSKMDQDKQVSARDVQMAKNLAWLHNEKFKGRKIIVWAASFHIARNLANVEPMNPSLNYDSLEPMGHHIHQSLGDAVFSVGFTASKGRAGPWMNNGFNIDPAPGGTLEDICEQAGLENAWIQLKSADESGRWLREPLYSRPLGYGWMKANWHMHFDAMIYNREMTKSTR